MSPSGFFSRSEITLALKRLRREWVVVAIFSMVANVLMLVPTLYMLQVYDRVLVSLNELTLLAISLITLFLFAIMAFAEWARSRLLVRVGVRLDRLLRERVFSAGFARGAGGGANPGQPFSDMTELRQFLTGPGIFAFFDLPWVPVYLGVLFLLHPLLGAVALGFTLIQAALAWLGHHRTVTPLEELAKSQTKAYSYIDGKLRNAEAVEAMGMLQPLYQRWKLLHADCAGRHAAVQGLTHRVMAWSKSVRYAQQSLSLATGALLVIDGQLTVGAMIAANVLMTRTLAPIDQLVSTWRGFVGARAAFRRLGQLLADNPPAPVAKPQRLHGEVQLRALQATAPSRPEPILRGIDLHAAPGSLTVVLGPSGSGKSTLARVLVAAWPVARGEYLIDGRPIAEWAQAGLAQQVGYLPQDTALFGGTIAENIARFFRVDSAKVISAARYAGLHEMVLRFPKGYDTPIGEAGRLLSGGQRQRIGLARALYGDPALLVLDEPNAHLDDAGEAALLETIRGLKERGKTIVMVTHRAGVLALADQVLVLHAGKVEFQGPRDQVFAQMQAARDAPPKAPGGALPAPQPRPA
ncbi:type I secretion system permease/ATPase [Verminephrobacter aporrectodeae]|uniref:Type I secretion system permease/ATPase n=1 Tax=Verminephrobacter aporrectodeae subsp. tuberculatae TaxID=1110392 RepID=A0ABT3KYG6_9BURK|nr:type I secretion system permease/ATPase [Verminephrobacter aporrectodeae]MCW5256256.1 type I secretion system permease/ATPase [Verminephrobacter aporrectodeae subsp. tuberculatae]MCW5323384.1 type I secretion system permease/ATPase [Verminephrobacter aporrectodeae subsp. tuberculatae]MCW8164411.1 type I secretion system permease/ATPase [Verminephrobacter aporrectodeae subsp. tuberculatae]MCW8171045.1 type I secretion system permease/ATPase [Verminephrobacter aporrectodeae subsp. tuberculatae